MKRILSVLIVLLFAISLHAQVTGGGRNTGKSNVAKSEKSDGAFYMHLNRSAAMGAYSEFVNFRSDILGGIGGMSKGIGLNIGRIFYFNNVDLAQIGIPNSKLGIDWTFIDWGFSLADESGYDDIADEASHIVGTKVGPVYSYSPIDKLVVDLAITLMPSIVTYHNYISNSYMYSNGYAFRKGLAIQARYNNIVSLGFDLSWGKANIFGYYYDDNNWEDIQFEIEMPTGKFALTLGLFF
jgi:hypothetical protein